MQYNDTDQQERLERLRKVLSPEEFASLQAGMRALYWVRRNAGIEAPAAAAVRVEIPIPKPPENKSIKIWPAVVLESLKTNTSGAARLYFLARSLDQTGRGMIPAGDLLGYMRDLKIGARKRQRWFAQACELGILKKVVSHGLPMIVITSLGRAAVALGADHVGLPATCDDHVLTGKGWRALAWSSYLTTHKEKPVSQKTKEQITGISPRTQRNYQKAIPGERIRNRRRIYLNGPKSDRNKQAAGLQDVAGMAVYTDKSGRTWQALPDTRKVPFGISRLLKRGASRRAQRYVNSHDSSSFPRRGSRDAIGVRLFCEGERETRAAIRQAQKLAPWEGRPSEVFELAKVITHKRGGQLNHWRGVAV